MEYSNDFTFTELCPYCYSTLSNITIKDFKPDYYGEKTCTCPNCNSKISLKQFFNKNYNDFNYDFIIAQRQQSALIPGSTAAFTPSSTAVESF